MEDDLPLSAHLDRSRVTEWAELSALAGSFATLDTGATLVVPPERADGTIGGFPYYRYSDGVSHAVRLLDRVGAVSPHADWRARAVPDHTKPGGLTPDEAVLAATGIVRGERFCDGTIAEAARTGLLEAVVVALAVWYRANDRDDEFP
ncbi:DUF6508 domain-containing protein [Yinghuangia seranimata]|uniref:DUF6508 domain-containing protein n=1 Tax=Yinghuangia seranimata TaxID=408067 RepID=UPI00248B57B4|nr:DUF6508 domain-containing protein [Yinghuangia seranimata]MDI2124868.1 DUF6508 domain-containing protein [Yinghuangia seranimata]